MTTTVRPVPRLPACSVCSQRKIKCDSNRPRCLPCSKADIDCVIHAGHGHQPLSRAFIHELEQRASVLPEPESAARPEADHDANLPLSTDPGTTSRSQPHSFLNVPDGSGLSFMRLLFADSEWRQNNTHLLRNLSETSHVPENSVGANDAPNPLQLRNSTLTWFNNSLSGPHVHNPFILKQEIENLHSRVFALRDASNTHSSHDHFRAFMIMALGSFTLHRRGLYGAHPFGFYTAAMRHFDDSFLANGIEAIQDLLLIARFGIYYHIGTSIWEIAHLCIRMCIEHGLHKGSTGRSDLLGEQLRRRVFWECYMIDRYSSNTLHRPFSIAERDISTGFPADANDEAIVAAQQIFPDLDTFRAAHTPTGLSEMSVFFLCVRLRQIVSRIHSEFSKLAETTKRNGFETFLLTGKICQTVDGFFRDLDEWRSGAPLIQAPRSLYESQDWFDLLHFRERLILVRKAVDFVPKRNGIPPAHLLNQCLECATSTIRLYSRLFQQGSITYTRSYFHMIFTAGLSVMFCVTASKDLRQPPVQETLRLCGETLRTMATKLPDAMHYVAIYEALHRNVERKWNLVSLRPSPTPHPADVGRDPPVLDLEALSAPGPSVIATHQPELPLDMQIGRITPRNSHTGQLGFPHDQPQEEWFTLAQDGSEGLQQDAFPADDPLQWGFLNDDIFWNMEAGLGEYAYGHADPSIARAFDFSDL